MGSALLKGSTAMARQTSRFAFTPIPVATDTTIHVPEGQSRQTLISRGDPLFSEAEGRERLARRPRQPLQSPPHPQLGDVDIRPRRRS